MSALQSCVDPPAHSLAMSPAIDASSNASKLTRATWPAQLLCQPHQGSALRPQATPLSHVLWRPRADSAVRASVADAPAPRRLRKAPEVQVGRGLAHHLQLWLPMAKPVSWYRRGFPAPCSRKQQGRAKREEGAVCVLAPCAPTPTRATCLAVQSNGRGRRLKGQSRASRQEHVPEFMAGAHGSSRAAGGSADARGRLAGHPSATWRAGSCTPQPGEVWDQECKAHWQSSKVATRLGKTEVQGPAPLRPAAK